MSIDSVDFDGVSIRFRISWFARGKRNAAAVMSAGSVFLLKSSVSTLIPYNRAVASSLFMRISSSWRYFVIMVAVAPMLGLMSMYSASTSSIFAWWWSNTMLTFVPGGSKLFTPGAEDSMIAIFL